MFTCRTLIVYCGIWCTAAVFCGTIKKSDKTVFCTELPEDTLSQILGPAFNSRYMSVNQPSFDDMDVDDDLKRKAGMIPSFYVDNDYAREITDEPAWNVNHLQVAQSSAPENSRKKRTAKIARQWECESKISWIDLGVDYFPRYLRSVECMAKTCWYGHYKCKPRSFTVKILRRKRGRCSVAKAGGKIGNEGLPHELRELWVWEERAVNFCCDCAL